MGKQLYSTGPNTKMCREFQKKLVETAKSTPDETDPARSNQDNLRTNTNLEKKTL